MKPRLYQIILVTIGAALTVLLSLALGFIAFRSLFSSDWTVYANPVGQFFRLLFRGIGFAMMILFAGVSILAVKKPGTVTTLVGLLLGFGAMWMSLASVFFYDWYFALILCVANLMILLSIGIPALKARFFHGEEPTD